MAQVNSGAYKPVEGECSSLVWHSDIKTNDRLLANVKVLCQGLKLV